MLKFLSTELMQVVSMLSGCDSYQEVNKHEHLLRERISSSHSKSGNKEVYQVALVISKKDLLGVGGGKICCLDINNSFRLFMCQGFG